MENITKVASRAPHSKMNFALQCPENEGRTQRERIFTHVSKEWEEAYHAGVFTEFMEQRAGGHRGITYDQGEA